MQMSVACKAEGRQDQNKELHTTTFGSAWACSIPALQVAVSRVLLGGKTGFLIRGAYPTSQCAQPAEASVYFVCAPIDL